MLGRALRVYNAIIRFFEREAIPVVVKNDNGYRDTHVVIFGEKVSIRIREPSRQSVHKLTDHEKEEMKRSSHSYAPKYDYYPTVKSVLEIGSSDVCSDKKDSLVEDQLQEFICAIIKTADRSRIQRIEWEKREQKWELERQWRAELAGQREIELQRRTNLEKGAENWTKSIQLREYVEAVEAKAAGRGISEKSNEDYAFWLRWAKSHADRLDPLSGGLPFETDNVAEE